MKIDVLGTNYEILFKDYSEDPLFGENSYDGYCDSVDKEIVICNMKTFPTWENYTDEYCKRYEKGILRHELIHAFLNESGLQDNAITPIISWAKNEEMIDWIAIQFPKIVKAMKEAGCLES